MPRPALIVYTREDRVGIYLSALETAGVPLAVKPADRRLSLADYSGLVLMGGTDIDAALYGEAPHPEAETPDPERDAVECALLREAIDRDLPVLAICRGLQMLNVFHGGTLDQHLASHEKHRQGQGDRGAPVHQVQIIPETLLYSIANTTPWAVNSRHHQAVARLGPGLIVSAKDTEDGVIEAIELPGRRYVLGVQWHPEDQAPRDSEQRKLFTSFARALEQDKGQ